LIENQSAVAGWSLKELQSSALLRKFHCMMISAATIGFLHLRRPWIENPGWVAV
jgi:hypothetical protein